MDDEWDEAEVVSLYFFVIADEVLCIINVQKLACFLTKLFNICLLHFEMSPFILINNTFD